MEIKRFKPIKYRVGRYMLTLRELNYLRYEVAIGIKPVGLQVSQGGVTAEITETGNLTENLPGIFEEHEPQFLLLKANRPVPSKN